MLYLELGFIFSRAASISLFTLYCVCMLIFELYYIITDIEIHDTELSAVSSSNIHDDRDLVIGSCSKR